MKPNRSKQNNPQIEEIENFIRILPFEFTRGEVSVWECDKNYTGIGDFIEDHPTPVMYVPAILVSTDVGSTIVGLCLFDYLGEEVVMVLHEPKLVLGKLKNGEMVDIFNIDRRREVKVSFSYQYVTPKAVITPEQDEHFKRCFAAVFLRSEGDRFARLESSVFLDPRLN